VSDAREEILGRIRAAVGPVGSAPDRATAAQLDAAYAAIPRTYRRAHHDPDSTDIVELFAERAADYRAVVERVPAADLPAAVARALAGVPKFLVPDGLPSAWLADVSADYVMDGKGAPTLSGDPAPTLSGEPTPEIDSDPAAGPDGVPVPGPTGGGPAPTLTGGPTPTLSGGPAPTLSGGPAPTLSGEPTPTLSGEPTPGLDSDPATGPDGVPVPGSDGGPGAGPDGGLIPPPDGGPVEPRANSRIVRDHPPLSARELDAVAGVVTGCAVAVAETGTVILDHGPGQGRRALTLVPDFHLVVVEAAQVAADLADALDRLDPARPHTLISGPSATSDIELIRVEGVHGPRNLHILIVG
jgi:L-lactate utilization protein LutC